MPAGTITWFNSTTGRGLIAPDDGGDPVAFFVRDDQRSSPQASALAGRRVEYQVGAGAEATIDLERLIESC